MASTERSRGLDHVVVVTLENRTFDNLLGRLCGPGEVASFEGWTGKDLSLCSAQSGIASGTAGISSQACGNPRVDRAMEVNGDE